MDEIEKPADNPETNVGQRTEPTAVDKLLESPDIQRAIAQIPDLIKTNIESKRQSVGGATRTVLLWAGVLIVAIIIPVSLLTAFDKLSSDAAAFVFGAIVGAAFTFIRTFFGQRN